MSKAETLRDRWMKMTPEERAAVEPSGLACVGCGKPAGTPWSPFWCPDCDDKRIARIDEHLKEIGDTWRMNPTGGWRMDAEGNWQPIPPEEVES